VKISTRLNLLSLVTILVMTTAVFGAAVFFLQADQRQSRERLMLLELHSATQSIRQQLNRSGVVAASKEAEQQLQRLRRKEGFASATLFIVERNDNRFVYHPDSTIGERANYAFVDEMLRRQTGSLEYDYRGDQRMAVFHMLEPIDWLVGVAVSRKEVYAPLSGFMLDHMSWRWVFVLQGLPPLVWAVVWWFAVADRAGAPAPLAASPEFAALCPSSATCMRLDLRATSGGPGAA